MLLQLYTNKIMKAMVYITNSMISNIDAEAFLSEAAEKFDEFLLVRLLDLSELLPTPISLSVAFTSYNLMNELLTEL
jgi:hypothetical protein